MAEAPKQGRLTLYEDLLSAETRAQMAAKDAAAQAEAAKKKSNASLMFKPTNLGKKPTNTTKPKPSFASMQKAPSGTSTSAVISAPPTIYPVASSPSTQDQQSSSTPAATPAQQQGKQGQKRGFNDWLADEDEEWQYYERPRGDRNSKKKKKKNKQVQEQIWSWDDIYDPTVPVNFLEYPRSDAQYDVNDAWKRRLYAAHRKEMRRQGKTSGCEENDKPKKSNPTRNLDFAPPSGLSFAPPADYSSDGISRPQSPERSSRVNSDAPPYPPVELPKDETGDEAFARRMALSQAAQSQPPAVPHVEPREPAPTPVAATVPKAPTGDAAEKAAKAAAQIAALKAKIAASRPAPTNTPPATVPLETQSPAPNPSAAFRSESPAHFQQSQQAEPPVAPPPSSAPGTISAAPTFNPEYLARKAQGDDSVIEIAAHQADPDEPRSNRPGQAGFAERMLKKMGWEKGQGLGKEGDGITTAIVAKAEKRKKLPDAAGGGFVVPANMGKIVGGKKKKKAGEENIAEQDGEFGKMSEVIKLEGMLKGLDVDQEIQDNNLLQEIGDEMGQYGKVERLFIWREHLGGTNDVFVKFTSQLSALRALKAMDGEEFADNVIKARYWDSEKFEAGDYA